MTIEKAITIIKNGANAKTYNEQTEAHNIAFKEMQKAIPMKIKEIHIDEYFCPKCGNENNCDQGNVSDKYCPNCGQRLIH